MAGGNVRTVQAAITAQNQFTDWVRIDSRNSPNPFTASLIDDSTTLSVTWVVQARRVKSDGTNGNAIDMFTSSAASNGGVQTASLAGVWDIRVGVKTGGYSAGSGVAALDW
jgi:hypothetical protein